MADARLYQIALTLLPQVGAVTARTLVSYCGGAEEVFRTPRKQLLKIPGIGPVVASGIAEADAALRQAEVELVFLEKNGIDVLFYTDPRYPDRLRHHNDSPVLLFFKGQSLERLNAPYIVSVVGTRQPTDYGRTVCEELVEGLKQYDAVVVSGLAFGIDVTAHRKALSLDLTTFAVLGSGLGRIYPSQHRAVAQRILENGGLLTEFTHQVGPEREHFPMRNRIIASLCDAVVVVETAHTGGSIITAKLAHSYGREIFAVPGRLRDSKSAGCNELIRSEVARLITSAADIAQSLGWREKDSAVGVQQVLFADLSADEQQLVNILKKHPQLSIDALAAAAQSTPGKLAALLLQLEFKGLVRTLPGMRYELVH